MSVTKQMLEQARGRKMTPHDEWEQRVSFVYGMLKIDDPRTIEDVKKSLARLGYPEPPK